MALPTSIEVGQSWRVTIGQQGVIKEQFSDGGFLVVITQTRFAYIVGADGVAPAIASPAYDLVEIWINPPAGAMWLNNAL